MNIFVKHEVANTSYATTSSNLVSNSLNDESPFDENQVERTFVDSQRSLQYPASTSTTEDVDSVSTYAPRPCQIDSISTIETFGKSISTSLSEASLPCEVSSTVIENNISVKIEPSDTADENETVSLVETASSSSSSSSAAAQSKNTKLRENQKSDFRCAKCPKSFSCYRGLQSHMKAHKRRFRFTARPQDLPTYEVDEYDDSADKDYEQPALMESEGNFVSQTWTTENIPSGSRAIKIEAPRSGAKNPRMFTCAECYKAFSCMKGLKIHLKSHRKRTNPVGQRKQRKSGTNNQRNGSQRRNSDQQLALDIAEQEETDEIANFDNEEDGDDHDDGIDESAIVETGSKSEGRVFLCALCGKRFCRRNHLVFHLRIHSGEKPYSCEFCPSKFSRADSLKVHMRIHTGERPYVCDICGAAFAQMINANVHRRCHTGEKPFTCEECGARFIKKDGLTVHRRIHTGEKPYSCDQCGARFAYRSCILSHYKVHNGDLIYKCEKCNAGFSLLCNLTRHKKVHADEALSIEQA